jgi:ATP-dependent Clp protease adapter protein ClpS
MYLYLLNDNTNSFKYVIKSLTSFLPLCNPLRAEQIAMIVHNTGECDIYNGFAPDIYMIYAAFQKAGLNVQIREYNQNRK